MSQWFECKVKYDKMMETGVLKTVTEPYLVDALSFTEAEARITEEMQPYISGEFSVSAVRRINLSDIFYNQAGDKWYKVKTNFITIDEKTAVEKKTATFQLVQASEFSNALTVFMEGMKDTMADFEIASITETALMDVFSADLKRTLADKAAEKE
ncbi:MAG: DUF4494 domain-containing protein [Bacteroidales bacterium]|uniref:DUF4494 domain-containing protein n=1 Tax=Sodaliphilus sp. TaxID=2815818 RepID=UPI001B611C33|nr:DUF4494 domain-containing protein [Candidatus Sodaliphilus limicaballi]